MIQICSWLFDAADRTITKTLKDGRTVNFGYDANGNVTSIIPPSRPAHGTAYNAADLPVSYTPPAAGLAASATQYAYNLDKQLTRITRPDGQAVDLGYDSGGRLSTVTTATGQTAYTYASSGRVASVGAASGVSLSYTYDGFLPKSETWSGAVAGSVVRAYNADFRVTSLTVGGQPPVAYGYDADGLPASAGAMTITRSAQNGFITGAALGGVATSYGYNTFGELASQANGTAGSALYNAQYTRGKLGRITQKAETVNGVPSVYGYVYDVAGRLVQVAKDGSVMSAYSYDANGDRIGKTDSVGTVAATYDDQDRLLAYGMNTYGYTANGELSGRNNPSGNTSYRYDPLGNLLSATLPDGRLIEYVVDGANRRVGRKVGGILTQGFLYANRLNPVAELDGTGNVVATFVYGTKGNVPDYMVKGGNSYRIISDHLGSPRVVVDSATGIVAQVMDYDEFGNLLQNY